MTTAAGTHEDCPHLSESVSLTIPYFPKRSVFVSLPCMTDRRIGCDSGQSHETLNIMTVAQACPPSVHCHACASSWTLSPFLIASFSSSSCRPHCHSKSLPQDLSLLLASVCVLSAGPAVRHSHHQSFTDGNRNSFAMNEPQGILTPCSLAIWTPWTLMNSWTS